MILIKRLKLFLAFLSALSLLFGLSASAKEPQGYNWHFKLQNKGEQPQILSGNSQFVAELGGLFLGRPEDKRIYLTFDCGYSNGNLEKILDILKEHNAKGAFFILPGIIKNSPHVVERMANEGHLVCNHTSTHPNISKITDINTLKSELSGAEKAYFRLTGKEMEKFFRPPQGAFSRQSLEFLQQLGYTPVFWSYAYADWDNSNQPNPEKALSRLISATHNGMVLLLHPNSGTNAAILSDFLTQAKQQGYSFGSLHELKASME